MVAVLLVACGAQARHQSPGDRLGPAEVRVSVTVANASTCDALIAVVQQGMVADSAALKIAKRLLPAPR
jgi:hypothetical protein